MVNQEGDSAVNALYGHEIVFASVLTESCKPITLNDLEMSKFLLNFSGF